MSYSEEVGKRRKTASKKIISVKISVAIILDEKIINTYSEGDSSCGDPRNGVC